MTLGALEPKFWQAWCEGVGRAGPASTTPSTRRARSLTPRCREIFRERTREQWRAFASEHDCCLEPVLGLDEALESELVAAREMVVELAQPGAERPVRLLGVPIKLEPHARRSHPSARAGARRAHRRGAVRRRGSSPSRSPRCTQSGAVAGAGDAVPGSFVSS